MGILEKLILTIPILGACVLALGALVYSYIVVDMTDHLRWEKLIWNPIKAFIGILMVAEITLLIIQIWIG